MDIFYMLMCNLTSTKVISLKFLFCLMLRSHENYSLL